MPIQPALYPAILRIVRDGRAIGGGVLLGERRVATCAHVVDAAIPGREPGTQEPPQEALTVEFPALRNHRAVGRVVAWAPYRQPLAGVCDIAIIELDDLPPAAAAASRRLRPGEGHHHCQETVCAFGFPRTYDGSTIEARLKSTRIGDEWLEIAGGSEPNYFVAKGVSGAGVFSASGYLLGLACAFDPEPLLKEALAIPIAAVNQVLSTATLAAGGKRGDADLRFWLKQLQSCAETAVSDGNNLGDQLAEAMCAYAEWFDEDDDDEIARLQTIHADLCALEEDAEANLLRRYFQIVPLGPVLDRLQALAQLAGRAAGAGKRVSNLRAEDPSFFGEYIEPLIAEVDASLRFINSDEAPLDSTERQSLSRDLKRLRYLVSALSYDLGEIDRLRARLERARDLLRRTITLTQVLLGQHAHELPDLAVFRDRVKEDLVGPEMVIIPAGSFLMGSPPDEEQRHDDEGPQHAVRIARRFALGRYPVTFEEYDAFAVSTLRRPPGDEGWGRGRRPVINVSWDDGLAYTAWLSERTGADYRLPSEAEWEYACRAGTTSRYSFGDAITPEQAACGPTAEKTTEVGGYPANPWDLYDMHGNVWEWCADVRHENYDGAPDYGSAWIDGGDHSQRMMRGGTWNFESRHLRSATRAAHKPDAENLNWGFRVARTLR